MMKDNTLYILSQEIKRVKREIERVVKYSEEEYYYNGKLDGLELALRLITS